MNNFNYSIPTEVYFGKGQIKNLAEIANLGTKVLMVYGGGSIKRNPDRKYATTKIRSPLTSC